MSQKSPDKKRRAGEIFCPLLFLKEDISKIFCYFALLMINNRIMAVLSMFYGLIISMFYGDNKQHKLPHIHVKYQDFEAVFSIPDGELITGDLPKKKIKLVQAWIIMHEEDLMANWELATNEMNIFKIEPLR